jgi:hypothetical protein
MAHTKQKQQRPGGASFDEPEHRLEVENSPAASRIRREPHLPPKTARWPSEAGDRFFFLAERQNDGTYSVTLTDAGMQAFETALGLADDLGGRSRISPYSTIADLMERTATREELSQLLRRGGQGLLYRVRLAVLRRKLRGTENPSSYQRLLGHIARAVIVVLVGLWALNQFAIAVRDIEAIPGILARLPTDLLHLQPTLAFSQVGARISDAGQHVLYGVLGACLTYVLAKLIHPFARIYRKDQVVPGERPTLRLVNRALRKAEARSGSTAAHPASSG